jgi:hypothetical protein
MPTDRHRANLVLRNIWVRSRTRSGRTDTTALFSRIHVQQRQGLLRTLLRSTFATTPTPKKQRVQLIASEAGEGRTRLTVIESRQGEWPEIQTQLEQWIVEELAGTYWPV